MENVHINWKKICQSEDVALEVQRILQSVPILKDVTDQSGLAVVPDRLMVKMKDLDKKHPGLGIEKWLGACFGARTVVQHLIRWQDEMIDSMGESSKQRWLKLRMEVMNRDDWYVINGPAIAELGDGANLMHWAELDQEMSLNYLWIFDRKVQ